jgi:hypothetical protein
LAKAGGGASKTVTDTALMDVQARWGYSEIVDSKNFSALYDSHPFAPIYRGQLDALRAKRRSDVLFKDLNPQERYWLAFMCWCIRPNLMIFMTGVDRLREVHLNKTTLGTLIVPPMVSNIPKLMRFGEYIETPCSEPGDARNATGGYHPSADPLTIGRLSSDGVLLDGYHRAASFWKFAPANASISAYEPTPMSAASKMG